MVSETVGTQQHPPAMSGGQEFIAADVEGVGIKLEHPAVWAHLHNAQIICQGRGIAAMLLYDGYGVACAA
jgi:hypothetical protein